MGTEVISGRLDALEATAVANFGTAVMHLSDALDALVEIKETGAWRERLIKDAQGELVPVHTDYARQYLPWFAEEYADAIGGLSASALRHRIRWVENCKLLGWTTEQSMRVSLTDQLAAEEVVQFGGSELTLKRDPTADHETALAVVRDVIEGNANAVTLRSEYGIKNGPHYFQYGGAIYGSYMGSEAKLFSVGSVPVEILHDVNRKLRVKQED